MNKPEDEGTLSPVSIKLMPDDKDQYEKLHKVKDLTVTLRSVGTTDVPEVTGKIIVKKSQ
jgi:hypothetical protein